MPTRHPRSTRDLRPFFCNERVDAAAQVKKYSSGSFLCTFHFRPAVTRSRIMTLGRSYCRNSGVEKLAKRNGTSCSAMYTWKLYFFFFFCSRPVMRIAYSRVGGWHCCWCSPRVVVVSPPAMQLYLSTERWAAANSFGIRCCGG